jgi:hypothetical protein
LDNSLISFFFFRLLILVEFFFMNLDIDL